MTYKEKKELENLRERVKMQRDEIRRLTSEIKHLQSKPRYTGARCGNCEWGSPCCNASIICKNPELEKTRQLRGAQYAHLKARSALACKHFQAVEDE